MKLQDQLKLAEEEFDKKFKISDSTFSFDTVEEATEQEAEEIKSFIANAIRRSLEVAIKKCLTEEVDSSNGWGLGYNCCLDEIKSNFENYLK